ncbi:MAG: hypothetical protein A2X52_00540 [Candidatus Rokubacteria bacterium GWC2_70_16]|nr:MAG: hypothetical protein A2X52_00540 [Candidatus Rokubacteria bacterium GWC2_70_16]
MREAQETCLADGRSLIRVAQRGHAADAPYAVAVVTLKKGGSLLGRVVDIRLKDVSGRRPRLTRRGLRAVRSAEQLVQREGQAPDRCP